MWDAEQQADGGEARGMARARCCMGLDADPIIALPLFRQEVGAGAEGQLNPAVPIKIGPGSRISGPGLSDSWWPYPSFNASTGRILNPRTVGPTQANIPTTNMKTAQTERITAGSIA